MLEDSGDLPRPGPLPHAQLVRLIERYLPLVRTHVRLQVGAHLASKEAVSDLVQSTVRQIYAAKDGLHWIDEPSFKAYLHTCVTNKILEKQAYWSRQKRDAQLEVPLDSDALPINLQAHTPSEIVIRGESIRHLQEAFDQLEPLDRQLFSMAFVFQLPQVRIANELGMPESTVRRKLLQLQVRLASILHEHE